MNAAGVCVAPSGEAAGASFRLFHVWFDACWDAGCVCWQPFIAHTCANWQLSDLQVPVWNLRQMGFPLCDAAQAFLDLPFPFPLPFLRGGSDFCGRLAGRLGCLGLRWARLAGGGAGTALAILGRSIRSE